MMLCRTTIVLSLLSAFMGLAMSNAHAIVVRSNQSDTLYQNLGSKSVYASVGRLDGTTNRSGFLASGTLIAPDWVLTAAHVVDNAKTLSFTIGGETYEVDRKISNPNWNGNLWSGYDIGLVHLSKVVPNVAPAVIYTGSGELNQTDTVVGYGKTATLDSGLKKADGRKRAAQNVISQIENNRLLVAKVDEPLSLGSVPLGAARSLPLEGLIAPGDSGGGLFITTASGTYLAGVNSFIGSGFGLPVSDYGNFSGHTRVSAFSRWIESNVRGDVSSVSDELAEAAGAAPAPTLIAAPEPGSLALLAAAGVCLAISRRLLRRSKARS